MKWIVPALLVVTCLGSIAACDDGGDSVGSIRAVDTPVELRNLLRRSGVPCRDYERGEQDPYSFGPQIPLEIGVCFTPTVAYLLVFRAGGDMPRFLEREAALRCPVVSEVGIANPAYVIGRNWLIQLDELEAGERIARRLDGNVSQLC